METMDTDRDHLVRLEQVKPTLPTHAWEFQGTTEILSLSPMFTYQGLTVIHRPRPDYIHN